MTAASVALAVIDAQAATRRRAAPASSGHAATLDSASTSRDGRYQVGGGVVVSATEALDDAPMLAAGRWQVQGRLLPWNGADESVVARESDRARGSHAAADLSGAGAINVDDLLCLFAQWGACPSSDTDASRSCAADLDGDDTVSETDLLQMIRRWSMNQDD